MSSDSLDDSQTTLLPSPDPTPAEVSDRLLNDVIFAPIRAIVETADITRQCTTLDDLTFAILCVLRVLHSSKTGRDLLQTHGIPACPELNLKQSKSIYLVTQWKENLVPMTTMPRPFEPAHPANHLVISDETVYFNNTPGSWRKITSRSADNDEIFITLTNEMTLPPGVLSEVYQLRWNIEKAFDQQEQKLDEGKAWATSDTAKEIQAIAICIAHNLLQILKASLKTKEGIEDSKVIKAYEHQLDRREASAQKAGRVFPRALYKALYRPTELSLQFIRWLRVHLLRRTCYRAALALLRPLMLKYI